MNKLQQLRIASYIGATAHIVIFVLIVINYGWLLGLIYELASISRNINNRLIIADELKEVQDEK